MIAFDANHWTRSVERPGHKRLKEKEREKKKEKQERKKKSEQSILWLRTLVSVALASLSDTSGEIHARTTTVEEYLGGKKNREEEKEDRLVPWKEGAWVEERKIKLPIIKRQEGGGEGKPPIPSVQVLPLLQSGKKIKQTVEWWEVDPIKMNGLPFREEGKKEGRKY